MTVSREISLYKQWKKVPPVAAMVAGYLGYKAPEIGDIADLAAGGLPNV